MTAVPLNPGTALVVTEAPVGPDPSAVTICPSCGATIHITVKVQPTIKTHLMAMLLCFVCICLTLVPYTVASCQNEDHHCSNCDAYLGTYKR